MATRELSLPEAVSDTGDWHERVLRWMGGPDALPQPARSDQEWVRLIEAGLPTETVEAAVAQGVLSWSEIERHVLPRRTFSHRKARSQPLTPDESDRLLRLLRVIARAEDTFQDEEKARRWLRKPNRALDGDVPLGMLRTESGARLVEQVLERIAHGVYS